MKAETLLEKSGLYSSIIEIDNGPYYSLCHNVSEGKANEVTNHFNSALASHVESELTSKIEKIKAELSDECINEKLRTPDVKSGMIEMRDEILKLIEKK